jgi:four helix bundle protein
MRDKRFGKIEFSCMEKKAIRSYRDLEIWKTGIRLSVEIYSHTPDFQQNEQYGITSQIRLAAASIPSNISESYGRERGKTTVIYKNFTRISL